MNLQRFEDVQDCSTSQLQRELWEAGVHGVEPLEEPLCVAYHPDELWLEIRNVDPDDPRVAAVVGAHVPDAAALLPPDQKELLGLIEQQEAGTLDPEQKPQLDLLLASYVRDQLLGGR